MKHIFTFAIGLAGLSMANPAPTLAAKTEMPMAHGKMANMSPGMKMGGKNMRHMGPRQDRCTPMVHDFYWLDYARRMRMGMNRSWGGNANTRQNGQNRENRSSGNNMGRRMRVLHLKHDDFPPRKSGMGMSMRRGSGMKMGRGEKHKMSAGQSPVAADGRSGASRRMVGGERMKMRKASHARDNAPANAVFWLETPDSAIHHIDTRMPGKMSFPAPQWGLHKVFAYLDGGVRRAVRRKHFAFYSFYSHGDEAEKKPHPVLNGDGYWDGNPEFNLSRIYRNDRQRFSTQTGQEATFRITLHGKPVMGACVVMLTQKGWRNARRTDENGEVSFFLIKESETRGGWRTRRRAEKYLVIARHEAAHAGELKGQLYGDTRYLATMSLRVRPSQLEWESKSTAFLMAGFTVVAAGAAIAIRRRRRNQAAKSRKGA